MRINSARILEATTRVTNRVRSRTGTENEGPFPCILLYTQARNLHLMQASGQGKAANTLLALGSRSHILLILVDLAHTVD